MLWYCLQGEQKGAKLALPREDSRRGRVSEGDQQPFWRGGPCEDMLSTERQRARRGNWMVSSPDLSESWAWSRERRCRRTEEMKMGLADSEERG